MRNYLQVVENVRESKSVQWAPADPDRVRGTRTSGTKELNPERTRMILIYIQKETTVYILPASICTRRKSIRRQCTNAAKRLMARVEIMHVLF